MMEMEKQFIKDAIKEALQEAGMGWPRWLPTGMASRYSGLSAKTLRRLAREGEIYATNPGGGKLLFDRESIDTFMLKERAEIQIHLDRLKHIAL